MLRICSSQYYVLQNYWTQLYVSKLVLLCLPHPSTKPPSLPPYHPLTWGRINENLVSGWLSNLSPPPPPPTNPSPTPLLSSYTHPQRLLHLQTPHSSLLPSYTHTTPSNLTYFSNYLHHSTNLTSNALKPHCLSLHHASIHSTSFPPTTTSTPFIPLPLASPQTPHITSHHTSTQLLSPQAGHHTKHSNNFLMSEGPT